MTYRACQLQMRPSSRLASTRAPRPSAKNSTSVARQPSMTCAPRTPARRMRISSNSERRTWYAKGMDLSQEPANSNSCRRPSDGETNSAAHFSMPMALTWLATPNRSNSGRLAGNSDSPIWKRGWRAFSSNTSSKPRSASMAAAVEPAGPPPITSTSQELGAVGAIASVYRGDKDRSNVCNIRFMHILIVEDDQIARDYLAKALREAGHTVDVAVNGLEGLHLASSVALDLAIVDRMLPKLDGLALVQSLRATGRKTPVLILSALGEVDDRITGLRAGGDDYLTKPYHMSELLARVDALARRGDSGNSEANTKLKLADLELDRMTRRVMRNGKKIELTAREFQLLEFMMRHSGQVVTRTMLLEGVWDYHFDPQTNVIDVHISRLRQAIDKDFDKPLLHTVRGAGYSLREDE